MRQLPDNAHLAAAGPSPAGRACSLADIQAAIGAHVFGKPRQIRLAIACMLAGGHLLIEDVPGVGKTTLAQGLAQALGLSFSRIQFTSDLLPSDILGVSLFDRNTSAFRFAPGPIFAQLVLADEVNRASPRTQSALLEAMAEHQVTIEGTSYRLTEPFSVIATQNPADHSGTFSLPESQLDRFLMRISLGYPPLTAEKHLLASQGRPTEPVAPRIRPETLQHWQALTARIVTRDAVLDYILRLVRFTRADPGFVQGLSPRAGLALQRSAQAWALIDQRDHVVPEDIQAVLPAVVDHRLVCTDADHQRPSRRLLEAVDSL